MAETIGDNDVDMVKPETEALLLSEIKASLDSLERSVVSFDPRFTLRILRNLPALRKRVTQETLVALIESKYPDSNPSKKALLGYVDSAPSSDEMEVDDGVNGKEITPEVDIFVHLLVQVWLMNSKDFDAEKFKLFGEHAVSRLSEYNRRSLDYFAAKIWFYYARSAELLGTSESIVPRLLLALRTATLRHESETQASLIVAIVRIYLKSKKISQAANLIDKTEFPEKSTSNALGARYLYYLSYILAIQLDYSSAYEKVTAAIRKSPQTPQALGFLQAAHKLSIIVELLMGDIPERSVFRQAELEKSLDAYFDIVQSVRVGDVAKFSDTVARHSKRLKEDGTYSLVLRLRQNVIKTGIRIINLAYSRISLKDICIRLHLGNEESAEYVIAKAIRDGVIDAKIDHEKAFMQSKEILDVYSTSQPQEALHDRISFCMTLYNDSVKSMRYISGNSRVDLKYAEEAREREKELASEIQEGTDIDEDDGNFDI